MPLNLASPGILVKEFDLTTGRVQPTAAITGALVAPFAKGPIEIPTLVETENDLLNIFGEPYPTDKHYEHWLSASSYLAYGGNLRIVRADDNDLRNAAVSTGSTTSTDVKIKSLDHYVELGYDENVIPGIHIVAQNPGSWANGIKVAVIDSFADQILSGVTTAITITFNPSISDRSGTITGTASTIGISTAAVTLGSVVRCDVDGVVSAGTTVIGIGTGVISIAAPSLNNSPLTTTFDFGTETSTGNNISVGMGITQSMQKVSAGTGVTTVLDGYLKGIITGVTTTTNKVSVKVLSHVSAAGTETNVEYEESGVWSFEANVPLSIIALNSETLTSIGVTVPTLKEDWFEQQTIGISTFIELNWDGLSPRPGTTEYAESRGGRFDEVHIVVIDAEGKISGNAGTILEKHIGLSKASNATFSVGSPSYWRKYLAENSSFIFGGAQPVGLVTTGFGEDFLIETDTDWNQPADNVIFGAAGAKTYTLSNGKNYNGQSDLNSTGAFTATVAQIAEGYDLFENPDDFQVDFLLMGSANYSKEGAQSLANKLISVAELRKDVVAFISPNRGAILSDTSVQTAVTVNSSVDITENLVSFYASVASTTYAVFDSGYKYMYDRFSDTFRYVPLNGDIAGLCARTDINQFPWYSPAGTNRGAILNAVKLPYNPTRTQRDRLYTNRINPVIFSPGAGIILFGDKTGYGKSSAFDRINVRRLFIYLERAISRSARDVLFEFNDQLTRNNFINTIEPFLRDVKAKRGIFDFLVVCDERNNTPSVIDSNEFIADIYIKPSRSINFIGLNFIATKTGVNFEEVIGTF